MNEPAHSVFSPSGAHRWIACPASIQATIHLRDVGIIAEDESSPYAAEGTLAHEVAARALESGESVEGGEFEGSDLEAIEDYVEYVRFLAEGKDNVLFVESRVRIPAVDQSCFGTVDAAVVTSGFMHVIDLKFGRGVPVNAVNNPQMLLYASGLLDDDLIFPEPPPNDYRIILHIHMPRIPESRYPQGYETVWETTAGHVRAFAMEAGIAARDVTILMGVGGMPSGGYSPGEKVCKWCPIQAVCHARRDAVLADFDNLEDRPVTVVSDADLEKIWMARKSVMDYLKAVEEHIIHSFDGQELSARFPRLKIGPGRGSSAWRSETEVVRVFEDAGEDPWTKKLIGITEARKVLKPKSLVDALIERKPGNPVLMVK